MKNSVCKNKDMTGTLPILTQKVKNIDVHALHYCADADAYLLVGRVTCGCALAQHVSGWQLRHSDEIVAPRYYLDHHSAAIAYELERHNPRWRIEDEFFIDRQAGTVYAWEDECLMAHSKTITRNQAKKLINAVAEDYQIDPPGLMWTRNKIDASEYLWDEHQINFGHRDNVSLLHEMAHAIYEQKRNGQIYANHSPAFVWIAIDLYNRFAGLNSEMLTISAAAYNLLGDVVIDAQNRINLQNPAVNGRKGLNNLPVLGMDM